MIWRRGGVARGLRCSRRLLTCAVRERLAAILHPLLAVPDVADPGRLVGVLTATRTGSFMARTEIDLCEARALSALSSDQLAGLSNDELIQQKAEAYALRYETFSM